MEFNTKLLLEILSDQVVFSRVSTNTVYAWIDVVDVPSNYANGIKIIFASYAKENKWHFEFDRRPKIEKYLNNNHHVITDFETGLENTIQVKSLEESAKILYDYVFSKYHKGIKVIGVTGSVGKTTIVGALEYLLKYSDKKVLRFYSKRIFPLSLYTHYINKVDSNTEYIVMEYSLFHKNQIKELAYILPPTYAFIINVLNMHREERLGFNSLHDIFSSKLEIYVGQKTKKLFIHNSLIEYGVSKSINVEYFSSSRVNYLDLLPPTNRTFEMLGLIDCFLKIEKIKKLTTGETAKSILKEYIPVENRIIVLYINSKKIYFQGETSTAERLKSFIESEEVCILFIEEINFSEGNPIYYSNELKDVFNREKTYVLDSRINRNALSSFSLSVNFLDKIEFKEKIRNAIGYIVYHKALSVRFEEFYVEDYLKRFLEN